MDCTEFINFDFVSGGQEMIFFYFGGKFEYFLVVILSFLVYISMRSSLLAIFLPILRK